MGVHFFGRPKKRTKERRLDTRFLRTSGCGALTFLSLVINKSDGGAPNGVLGTNSGQKVRPEFVVALVTPMLDNTVERVVRMVEVCHTVYGWRTVVSGFFTILGLKRFSVDIN